MKILVVYDKEGNIIFSQDNATGTYNCLTEELDGTKEIAGIDVTNKKIIYKEKTEIEKTNEKIESLQKQLEEVQTTLDNIKKLI